MTMYDSTSEATETEHGWSVCVSDYEGNIVANVYGATPREAVIRAETIVESLDELG